MKAVLKICRALAIADFRVHGDVLQLAGAFVKPRDLSFIVPRKNDIRIGRIRRDVARFPSPYVVPVGAIDSALVAATRDCNRAVVLLCAINEVR